MKLKVVTLTMAAIAAAAGFAHGTTSSTGTTNPLRGVKLLAKGRLLISYHLPSNMRVYGVQFYATGDNDIGAAGLDVAQVPLHADAADAIQSVTANAILVNGRGVPLVGHWTYNVRLLFAARWHCHNGSSGWLQCHGVMKSPAIKITVGTVGSAIGPGTLVGESSDSGFLAQAIVDGPLPRNPQDVTVRARGTSSDGAVDIDWIVTCSTTSYNVVQRSGGWQDTLPIEDSLSVEIPPGNITSCDVQVSAALTADDGNGYISLRVYSRGGG